MSKNNKIKLTRSDTDFFTECKECNRLFPPDILANNICVFCRELKIPMDELGKEIDQSNLNITIVSDLGFIAVGNKKVRYATFLCKQCNTVFKEKVLKLKKNQRDVCSQCFRENRGTQYMKEYPQSRLYGIWRSMKSTTSGSEVCEEWNNFDAFAKWSHENQYDDTLRIDKDSTYHPLNCKWTTIPAPSQSPGMRTNNTLGYKGIKKSKSGKYVAQISVYGDRIHIGTYKTKELAALAYDKYVITRHLHHKLNFG